MPLFQRRVYRTHLLATRQLAEDTIEVSINRPEGFGFRSGQYLQLRVPRPRHRDARGPSRVLSIASSPLNDETLEVAFRHTGSGFKQTVCELSVGSELLLEGPHGHAVLPGDPEIPVSLVAGGIGITPFLSMLRFAAEAEDATPRMTLLYANASRARAAYLPELRALEERNQGLAVSTTFGPIDDTALRRLVNPDQGGPWFVAGPPAMVTSVRQTLHRLGVPDRRIHADEFVGYGV